VTAIAIHRFASAMENEARNLSDFDERLSLAVTLTDVGREMRRFQASQRMSKDLSEFEKSRFKVEDKMAGIGLEIKLLLVRIANAVMPIVERGLPYIEAGVMQIGAFSDMVQSQIEWWKGNQAESLRLAVESVNKQVEIALLLKKAQEEDDPLQDPFTADFLNIGWEAGKGRGFFPGLFPIMQMEPIGGGF